METWDPLGPDRVLLELPAAELDDLVAAGEMALQEGLRAMRDRWPALALHLVWGNHDRHAKQALEQLLATLGWHSCPAEGWRDGPVHGLHEPPAATTPGATGHEPRLTLLGHLHPGVRLQGRAHQRLRLPCFAAGPWGSGTRVLLPAYGHFTGQSPRLPQDCPWVYAIAQDRLMALPAS